MNEKRRLSITISTTFEIEVDEAFPSIDPKKVSETAKWMYNDWRDGRNPYVTETMERVSTEMCEGILHSIVDDYVRSLPIFSHDRPYDEPRWSMLSKLIAKKLSHTSKYWRHPRHEEGPLNFKVEVAATDDVGDVLEEETRG